MPLLRKPKRPHPRSLDALFPRPVVKRCPAGHTQTPTWRLSQGCSTCERREREFAERQVERTIARQQSAANEREAWRAALGPPPAELVMYCGDGKVLRFRIPKHLMRKPGSRRTRRRI